METVKAYCFDRGATLFFAFVILLIFIPLPILLSASLLTVSLRIPALMALLIFIYALYRLPLPFVRRAVKVESITAKKLLEVSMSRKDVFRAMLCKLCLIRLVPLFILSAVSFVAGLLCSSYTTIFLSFYFLLYFPFLVVESRRSVMLCDAGIVIWQNRMLKKWKDVRCEIGKDWIYLIPPLDFPYVLPRRREVEEIISGIPDVSCRSCTG
ncbi:hypothetical protein [Archaeoglobus veneficus]|uniref:Uncharacterized protein n=1 Tax=Archaeoglobus veneficus (strain DSM 11195 / SNP6) TaxID=693661 RepID=F2KQZ3_ARCVS|nr:hypothetical protein [Archaeoglobus veneficus]AEA47799.1 hypothetical protein Arcve_1803 [Archaeoglobus veneficus SNP6]